MERVVNLLVERLTDKDLKMNVNSITQTPRNAINNEVLDALSVVLKEVVQDNDNITAHRIKGGVGLSVYRHKQVIPVKIVVTLPNFDNDMEVEEVDYYDNLELAKAKKESKEKAKAEKIERDKAERLAKAKAKADKVSVTPQAVKNVNVDIDLEF